MTIAAPQPIGLRWGGWRRRWQQRWVEASPRTRAALQLTSLLLAVVIAYNYSLAALMQNAGLETPLAYISLVPAIALGLAAVRARPRRAEPQIHDREVDYIVGLPLIAVALLIQIALPHKLSAMFWVWRVDLLSLPLFVAGATAVVFGVRVLWRQKLAVGYLLLAWPVPYSMVLLHLLNGFTDLTLMGVRVLLHVAPVARPVPSLDGSLFEVVHHGHAFPLSVVSACSGINGIVGFLLIGAAFGALVEGPLLRKALWLAGGMLLLWSLNLGRLLFIFWAGHVWGEHIAVEVLHPFVGLVAFAVGVIAMMLGLRPFGLRISTWPKDEGTDWGRAEVCAGRRAPAVQKVFVAIVVVMTAAVVLGVADANLRVYNLVATASGEPKFQPYRVARAVPAGWRVRPETHFDWAKPLFGDDSTWYRFAMTPAWGGGDLPEQFPVTADVIDTGNLESFSAYGIEACYQFHGFALRNVAQVELSGGINGQTLSYSTPDGRQQWSILYWIVPVRNGSSTRYERVVLYVLNGSGAAPIRLPAHLAKVENLAGAFGGERGDPQLVASRAFLATFARELIHRQSAAASGGTLTATRPTGGKT